jgi:hypothetical protein
MVNSNILLSFTPLSKENKISKGNPGLGKVRWTNNSFCRVSSIYVASDASIVDLSIEWKVTPTGQVLYYRPIRLY